MNNTKEKILVGLSGGVDSAVAAYLLKKQGYDVHAVFMKNFSERVGKTFECPWKEDRLEAYRIASFLDIPIETWDFQKEYKARVLNYMFAEYQRGRTPNPDVMCNKEIKFKAFLDRAKKKGFTKIATGHYAAVTCDSHGIFHLRKAKDSNKDQSYFLAALSQKQLSNVIFPLARLTKPQVRALAKRIGLPNAVRPDSQGICFVGPVSMRSFLKTRIAPRRGEIVDTKGKILGQHSGVYYYTIGQRQGIGLGGGPARYVIDKDMRRNRLIVGIKDQLELFKKDALITGWHWLTSTRHLPLHCKVKIRYRQKDQSAFIQRISGTKVRARHGRSAKSLYVANFARPQRAVSPGQTLAAYVGTELVASGTIA